jgi:hypothetical protein
MFSLQRFFVWSLVLLVGLMLSSPTLAAYSQDTEQSATTIIESPSSSLQQQQQQQQQQQEHPRRQLWDFWSMVMLIHPPCPPKDALHQPPHCVEDSSGSSTNSANGSNYDGSASSSTSSAANMANTSSSANALGWWTGSFVVASVILAIVAMVIGSRRKEPPHEMQGAISRRVVAVAAFADHVLPPTASAQQEMV